MLINRHPHNRISASDHHSGSKSFIKSSKSFMLPDISKNLSQNQQFLSRIYDLVSCEHNVEGTNYYACPQRSKQTGTYDFGFSHPLFLCLFTLMNVMMPQYFIKFELKSCINRHLNNINMRSLKKSKKAFFLRSFLYCMEYTFILVFRGIYLISRANDIQRYIQQQAKQLSYRRSHEWNSYFRVFVVTELLVQNHQQLFVGQKVYHARKKTGIKRGLHSFVQRSISF